MSNTVAGPSAPPLQPPPKGLAQVLRSLRNRNFRLFFIWQAVSLIGNFMTQTATMWLVFRLSGQSALMLGVIGFAAQIPMFAIAPFGGVWVDRLDRRKLLIATQSLAMVQSFSLAILTLTHLINIPLLILLAVIQGAINAFDLPGRQAFVVDMMDNREDLANAIALNSTMVHGARLIGPAIGGLLIHFIGEGACFFIDSISYIGVISAFFFMTLRPVVQRRRGTSVLEELKEGILYAYNFLPIRTMLILLSIFSLTGFPALASLLPIYGQSLGDPQTGAVTYGFLVGASGIGAVIGALLLAAKRTVRGLVRITAFTSAGFGAVLIGFALSRTLWLSIPLVALSGTAMIVTFASLNTVLQTLAEDDKRGRVMSLYTMSLAGMVPWGSLIAGVLASSLTKMTPGWGTLSGATATLILMGSIAVAAGVWFFARLPALRKVIRPIYIQKGILPEVAAGLRGADAITGAGRPGA